MGAVYWGQMKTTLQTKLFKVRLVTQVDPSRPASERVEFIQAFDMQAAHKVAARLYPDVSRLGEIWVSEHDGTKAFDDFAKACDKAVGKCQDFIAMDINANRDGLKVDVSKVDGCEVMGIAHTDHPDYSDAYIASAKYDDPVTGEYRDLTEDELAGLPSEFVQEKVTDWIY